MDECVIYELKFIKVLINPVHRAVGNAFCGPNLHGWRTYVPKAHLYLRKQNFSMFTSNWSLKDVPYTISRRTSIAPVDLLGVWIARSMCPLVCGRFERRTAMCCRWKGVCGSRTAATDGTMLTHFQTTLKKNVWMSPYLLPYEIYGSDKIITGVFDLRRNVWRKTWIFWTTRAHGSDRLHCRGMCDPGITLSYPTFSLPSPSPSSPLPLPCTIHHSLIHAFSVSLLVSFL